MSRGEHFFEKITQSLEIFQPAFDFLSDGIGSDSVKNIIWDKRIGIDNLMAVDNDLVVSIKFGLITKRPALESSLERLLNDHALLSLRHKHRRRLQFWGSTLNQDFLLGRVRLPLAERVGIEGRYELVVFIINLCKNGIGIRNDLLFWGILGRLGMLGRTGIHPHRLQKIQVDKIEVQVAARLLFVGVEG